MSGIKTKSSTPVATAAKPAASKATATTSSPAKTATSATAKAAVSAKLAETPKTTTSKATSASAAKAVTAASLAAKRAADAATVESNSTNGAHDPHETEADDATVGDGDTAEAEAEVKKTRHQLTTILDIDISQARCATHLKQNLGDEEIEAEIKELRKELKDVRNTILTPKEIESHINSLRKRLAKAKDRKSKTATKKKTAKDDEIELDTQIESQIEDLNTKLSQEVTALQRKEAEEKIAELKEQIDAKSKSLIRLSSEAPIASAIVIDYTIKELIEHGLSQAKAEDGKLLEVKHIHTGPVTELTTYPLVRTLRAFKGYSPEHEDEVMKQKTEENKKAKEAREAKKAAAVAAKKAALAAAKKAGAAAKVKIEAEDEEDDPDKDGEHSKTTFFTYVDNAVKTVKKNDNFKNIRISNRVREYCSNLVTEFLMKMAQLAREHVQKAIGVRTLNASHIKAIISFILINEDRSKEEISPIIDLVNAKLSTYGEHQKTEKDRKALSMDEEKKHEHEEKKRQLELERKRKAIENAHKRAVEAEERAKKLALEVAKAEAETVAPPGDLPLAEPSVNGTSHDPVTA
jgi:hypothetical protein